MEQMIPLENDKVKTKKEERVISYSFKQSSRHYIYFPAGNYMFKANNRSTRARCEMCSKSKSNTLGAFIVNFEHILHLVLVFLLLTLSR